MIKGIDLQEIAERGVDIDEQNVLDKTPSPPTKKPNIYKNQRIMIDSTNNRFFTYINNELYFVNLTKG